MGSLLELITRGLRKTEERRVCFGERRIRFMVTSIGYAAAYVVEVVGDPIRPDFIITKIVGGYTVQWVGLPEHTYTLQKGSDLAGWEDDERAIENNGANRSIMVMGEESQSGLFFRLRVDRGLE